jgi:hypothetical protein
VRRLYSEKQRKHNNRVASTSIRAKVVPLSIVKPVPLNRLTTGTVVWAHIPFADGTGQKSRPAVVAKTKGRDITVLPGTTSNKRFRFETGYQEVGDLESAGLHRPTGINRIAITVDRSEIISICGRLAEEDATDLGFDLAEFMGSTNDAA